MPEPAHRLAGTPARFTHTDENSLVPAVPARRLATAEEIFSGDRLCGFGKGVVRDWRLHPGTPAFETWCPSSKVSINRATQRI
jgi:hypothetical protein